MSKCIECGNDLLSNDSHWQMGLCNKCWSAYRFFDKPIPLDNPYEKTIEELQQQLAEKDKEIENCKARIEELAEQRENLCQETEMLKSWKETYYKYWKEAQKQLQQLRHQVCEEIKKRALDLYYFVPSEAIDHFDGNLYLLAKYDLEEILDQIDQAKESIDENRN